MRKISFACTLLLAAAITFLAPQAHSQITNRAFDRQSSSLGFSLGFGRYDYFAGVRPLPTFIITYDHALNVPAGPGTISIGGAAGLRPASYRYGNGERDSWMDFMLGARGAYHVTFTSNTKWDVYGGAFLGFGVSTYNGRYSYDRDVYPVVGPFVGTSYRFGRSVGVYSELGYDISFFKIGLNVKF
jgi:hypothetical protein